jgi:hypothetical protein
VDGRPSRGSKNGMNGAKNIGSSSSASTRASSSGSRSTSSGSTASHRLTSTARVVAGLAHTHDLAGIGEGLLNSPPCGIAGYHIFCGRLEIGGHQWKPITAVVTIASPGLVVANQNDRTVRLRNEPYHKQAISVICTASPVEAPLPHTPVVHDSDVAAG